jgi:hypothetical protein
MMRKSINIILAASLLMSCSASNDAPDTLADGSHAVKLDMTVGVSAGVVGSRELDTWDGAQQVNDMRIYVFRCPKDKKGTSDEEYTYCIPNEEAANKGYYSVDAFKNTKPYYSAEHQNMPEQHSYTIEPYLKNGYYYQFLAIGRDDKNATKKVLTEPKFTENETKLEDARIALTEEAKNSANPGILNTTELFSGILQDEKTQKETPVLVTEETKYFHRTLTASRNVAGLMIYVENIPAKVESNAAGDESPVTFTPTSLSVVATGISTETLIRKKQAPADAEPLTYQTLGTIDLTSNGWTVDTEENIFKRAEDIQKGWKANSYMISNFMMPTPEEKMQKSKNSAENETTFYLHYTDGTHHRYDNIRKSTTTGDKFKFPIEANHLYCLGAKSKDVNQPYDLKEYYEPVMTDVKIEIEPAFEKKHEFETE